MIKYEQVSEAIYVLRRSPVIVIFHGDKTPYQLRELDKLKGFVFLSDKWNFLEYIAGMHCSGLIIEEDVEVADHNIEYALSRLRYTTEDLIFHMTHAHKEQIGRILDRFARDYEMEDLSYVQGMKKQLGIHSVVKLFVED